MIHYLYLLTFKNGNKYIGARTTSLDRALLDTKYLGSGRDLPVRNENTCTKTILKEFSSREDLIKAEIEYIKFHECTTDITYYNKRISTYDRHGDTSEATSLTLKGRTKESHKYIEETSIKNSKYIGEFRTPAQKHQDAKMRGAKTGPNTAKGHKGTTNSAFEPWYSISPSGVKTDYRDITKKDAAYMFDLTPRQMTHRFHYTNIDKPAKKGKIKGWIFGNL